MYPYAQDPGAVGSATPFGGSLLSLSLAACQALHRRHRASIAYDHVLFDLVQTSPLKLALKALRVENQGCLHA